MDLRSMLKKKRAERGLSHNYQSIKRVLGRLQMNATHVSRERGFHYVPAQVRQAPQI